MRSRISFAILLLACCVIIIACVTPVVGDVVLYMPCDDNPNPSAVGQSVTWSSKDNDRLSSVLTYRLCSRRPADLRYVSNLQLTAYANDVQTMVRDTPICAGTSERRQACIQQLNSDGCLSGSIVLRVPVQTAQDKNGRSEIVVTESGSGIVIKLCSLG